MCLGQGPQHSDAGEARTRGPSVSSQALYHWATALPVDWDVKHQIKQNNKEKRSFLHVKKKSKSWISHKIVSFMFVLFLDGKTPCLLYIVKIKRVHKNRRNHKLFWSYHDIGLVWNVCCIHKIKLSVLGLKYTISGSTCLGFHDMKEYALNWK